MVFFSDGGYDAAAAATPRSPPALQARLLQKSQAQLT